MQTHQVRKTFLKKRMALKKISFYPGDIPAKPGVYIYRDSFGTVIYVGKAANLRKRMSQYFQPSRETRADPKLRSLINSIDTWECLTVRSEDEALILESRLIKEYAPKYNVLLRDDKRHLLLKIDLSERFPRPKTARLRKDDSCLYFGPFPHGGALRQTLDFLIRHYALRSCIFHDPGREEYTHCLAAKIRDCCCPCIGKVTEAEYRERLDSLIDLLNGNVDGMLELLRKNPQVCLSFVAQNQAAEDKFTTYFQSANVVGTACEVTDGQEKVLALRALCEKLTPANMTGDNFDRAIAKSLPRTGVWRIQIEEATGKEKRRS